MAIIGFLNPDRDPRTRPEKATELSVIGKEINFLKNNGRLLCHVLKTSNTVRALGI